jgi:hypothetical protein
VMRTPVLSGPILISLLLFSRTLQNVSCLIESLRLQISTIYLFDISQLIIPFCTSFTTTAIYQGETC